MYRLHRVTVLDPSHAEAYFLMGKGLARRDDLQNAFASFIFSTAARPSHADAYYNLGMVTNT